MNADADIALRGIDLQRSFRMGRQTLSVLNGVSLDLRKGECLFLCGASGSGKSTLLYTLAGMERPEAGRVFLDGVSLYDAPELQRARLRNRRMGFVFQSFCLLPELTALENVLLPAMIGKREGKADATEMLAAVGLGERMGHLPGELSGGEQQRVAIARAMVNGPDILFADELTGNLDAATGGAIVDLLLALVREKQKSLLVVTHDMELAQRGDRLVTLRDGLLA